MNLLSLFLSFAKRVCVAACVAVTVFSSFAEVGWGGVDAVAEGDLIFVLPHVANAVTEATGEADHVAIAHRIGGPVGPLYVVEAIGRGVCLTPIDTFLARNAEADLVAHAVPGLDVPRSVRNALGYVGCSYDWNYTPGDSALYCSELVQLCYVDTAGHEVFHTVPMSFSDGDGNILPHWRDHYNRQSLPVPEGSLGSNPTQLLHQLPPPMRSMDQ